MPHRALAFLAVIVAMLSIQSGASLAKQLFPLVGPQGTTTLRLFFATLVLFAFWRPWKRWPQGAEWKAVALYGASLAGMNLLFFQALARIPLGVAVALEFVGPLAVALLASRQGRDFMWAGLAGLGLVLLLPLNSFSTGLDGLGVAFALAAGGFWALYIVFGKRLSGSLPGGIATALGMSCALLIALPFGVAQAGADLLDVRLVPLGLAVGVLSSALPYSLEMIGLKRLPTQTFGILMSVEPAVAALSGLLFLGERLSLLQIAAIGLVMAASVGSTATSQAPIVPAEA